MRYSATWKYTGQNDSEQDRRDFIIRRHGGTRLDGNPSKTARHKPIHKYTDQSSCAQPEEELPLQIPCCHQGSNRTPVHMQQPGRDTTVATRTTSSRLVDREIAVKRLVPTLALTTTQGKSKIGSSNNHTNHCDGKGEKSPPPCTRIRATKDTSEEETIHARADAVTKLYHPNQRGSGHIWNTSGCVHRLCIAWNPGQYSVNRISINKLCKKYTHKILSNEHNLNTKNKTRETATTQTPGELPKYQIAKMGVSQIRFMADTNISTNKNDNRRIRFHGEPLSTNQRRQGPEPTIMEQYGTRKHLRKSSNQRRN